MVAGSDVLRGSARWSLRCDSDAIARVHLEILGKGQSAWLPSRAPRKASYAHQCDPLWWVSARSIRGMRTLDAAGLDVRRSGACRNDALGLVFAVGAVVPMPIFYGELVSCFRIQIARDGAPELWRGPQRKVRRPHFFRVDAVAEETPLFGSSDLEPMEIFIVLTSPKGGLPLSAAATASR